jgi:hypothetical protein
MAGCGCILSLWGDRFELHNLGVHFFNDKKMHQKTRRGIGDIVLCKIISLFVAFIR